MTATNRPTDAELVKLLRYAARNIPASLIGARMLDAADALDAAPARLTPEQWQEAVERGFRGMDADYLDGDAQIIAGDIDATLRSFTDAALRAAFPHLAPDA